jgi:hypothetical protein
MNEQLTNEIYHTERPDNEMMHGLIRILEKNLFGHRKLPKASEV